MPPMCHPERSAAKELHGLVRVDGRRGFEWLVQRRSFGPPALRHQGTAMHALWAPGCSQSKRCRQYEHDHREQQDKDG